MDTEKAVLYIQQSSYEFGKFGKLMEIDNTIFQDLEIFGKETFFNMAMEKFWNSCLENF